MIGFDRRHGIDCGLEIFLGGLHLLLHQGKLFGRQFELLPLPFFRALQLPNFGLECLHPSLAGLGVPIGRLGRFGLGLNQPIFGVGQQRCSILTGLLSIGKLALQLRRARFGLDELLRHVLELIFQLLDVVLALTTWEVTGIGPARGRGGAQRIGKSLASGIDLIDTATGNIGRHETQTGSPIIDLWGRWRRRRRHIAISSLLQFGLVPFPLHL